MEDVRTVEQAEIEEPAVLIRINRLYHIGINAEELYHATRGVWRVGETRNKVKYAFAVYRGSVCEVYEVERWLPAGTTPYPSRSEAEVNLKGRWEFVGSTAPSEMREKYLNKSVAEYFRRKARNPIRYVNV